ncbi:hypothetical protein ACIPDS_02925 [Kluyvera sp. NPDC087067]|uniref:hypothetical protein n=1 Tax=Kluyvera sp. NPDC087067 TaxID=3364105 RepID=UPI0037F1CFCC
MRKVGKSELRNSSWEEYLGDSLRGKVPVNQLTPKHPYLLNTLGLEDVLHKNTEHILLLTLDEAYTVVNSFYNIGTTYAGNIKDTLTGGKNIVKLISYHDSGKLVFNLKSLGIKAISYIHKGVVYIKVTGYPSLRRIINGTRYSLNNLKILELSITKAGISEGVISGTRFCIYFAGAVRIAELIFSSAHDVAQFIGNITMDVAKAIVSLFLTRIAVNVFGGTAMSMFVSSVVPISVTIFFVVSLGVAITYGLYSLDKSYQLSPKLIESIKKGLAEHRKIQEWNLKRSNPYLWSMINAGQ